MKTAISIPDNIFKSAEILAKRLGVSRSELYSKAVEDFLKNNKSQGVTDALNEIYSQEDNSLENEMYDIQSKSIGEEDW